MERVKHNKTVCALKHHPHMPMHTKNKYLAACHALAIEQLVCILELVRLLLGALCNNDGSVQARATVVVLLPVARLHIKPKHVLSAPQ